MLIARTLPTILKGMAGGEAGAAAGAPGAAMALRPQGMPQPGAPPIARPIPQPGQNPQAAMGGGQMQLPPGQPAMGSGLRPGIPAGQGAPPVSSRGLGDMARAGMREANSPPSVIKRLPPAKPAPKPAGKSVRGTAPRSPALRKVKTLPKGIEQRPAGGKLAKAKSATKTARTVTPKRGHASDFREVSSPVRNKATGKTSFVRYTKKGEDAVTKKSATKAKAPARKPKGKTWAGGEPKE